MSVEELVGDIVSAPRAEIKVYVDHVGDAPDPRDHDQLHEQLAETLETVIDDVFKFDYLEDPTQMGFQTAIMDELLDYQFGLVVPLSLKDKYRGKTLMKTVLESIEAWKEDHKEDITLRLENLREEEEEFDEVQEDEDRQERYNQYLRLKAEFEPEEDPEHSCKCKGKCKEDKTP